MNILTKHINSTLGFRDYWNYINMNFETAIYFFQIAP